MKLTVLGKYGPYPTKNGNTSGYLLQSATQNALIDVGAGTVSKLKNYIEVKDVSFIILSHLHFDHISDIGVLSYALSFSGKDKVNLYLPKTDCDAYDLICKIKEFNVIEIIEDKVYKEGDLTFSFYKTKHPINSFGVKINDSNKTFGYTGDTGYFDGLENLSKGCDLLVADGAFLDGEHTKEKPHMSISQAVSLQKFAKKVIVSHINPNYLDETLKSEIKKLSVLAELAIEGNTYDI